MTITREMMDLHKETLLHMERCSQIAKEFGAFLNLSENEISLLSECALKHDLGKLFIPVEILYKKDKLTDEEFQIIKSHTNYKFETESKEVQESIAFHHERADGLGYYKVNYDNLSMYPKIISLIDCYDVMNNKRSYKNTIKSKEDIILDIESNLGKHFDRHLGEQFIEFLKRNK